MTSCAADACAKGDEKLVQLFELLRHAPAIRVAMASSN
ncbi:hypothetical protein GGI59_004946 [Rhizobium lentis]|uniref:Uncharacterized protein n=1 Tax=Rhizobium lentis TaxID=1138194 RepID=A0A7W8XI50_9HYPH|nr:hypothetical protein [Rhizobium lentis]MBB5552714.1 hypothetical protein [Rhizobium lentis]MBB5563254.1 hypothetical protein [Rhizobium lentis]MBB5569531.1 hypothetical protein [Rhizobium lentis]